jgi:uncharacterized membrane protein YwzB
MPPIPELLKSVAGAVVRWALTAVGTYFVAKGWLTGAQVDQVMIFAGLALAALLWSFIQKYLARTRFLAALGASPDTPEADVKKEASKVAPAVAFKIWPLIFVLIFTSCDGDTQRKTEEAIRKIYVGLQGASDGLEAVYVARVRDLEAKLTNGSIDQAAFDAGKKQFAAGNLAGQEGLRKVANAVKIFKERVRALTAIDQANKAQLLPLLDQVIIAIEQAQAVGLVGVTPELVAIIKASYELIKAGVTSLITLINSLKGSVPVSRVPALVQ